MTRLSQFLIGFGQIKNWYSFSHMDWLIRFKWLINFERHSKFIINKTWVLLTFFFFLCYTAILDMVCETFLKRNVSAILFLSNTELYGRNIAAAQYFLQLTNYLRIPVVAWNADNSGLEKVKSISYYIWHHYFVSNEILLPACDAINALKKRGKIKPKIMI
jgi:hypothetical protein